MEYQAEIVYHQERLNKIEEVYRQISNALRDECADFNKAQLYESLSQLAKINKANDFLNLRLSTFMEGKPFRLSPDSNDVRTIMTSKWDSTSSILYALSILVCTQLWGHFKSTCLDNHWCRFGSNDCSWKIANYWIWVYRRMYLGCLIGKQLN